MRQLKKVNVSNNSIEMYSVCSDWKQCRPETNNIQSSSMQTNQNYAGTTTTTTTTTTTGGGKRRNK